MEVLFGLGWRKIFCFLIVLVEVLRGLGDLVSLKCNPLDENSLLCLPKVLLRSSWAQLGERRKNPSLSSALSFREWIVQSWAFVLKEENYIEDSMREKALEGLCALPANIGTKAELVLLPRRCDELGKWPIDGRISIGNPDFFSASDNALVGTIWAVSEGVTDENCGSRVSRSGDSML